MKTFILTVCLVFALPLQAQTRVYKCQQEGKTVFSDTPCAADATIIDVHPAAGNVAASPAVEDEAESEEHNVDAAAETPEAQPEPDITDEQNQQRRQEITNILEEQKQRLQKLETEAQTRLTQLEYELTQPDKREKAEKLIPTLTDRYHKRIEQLRGEIGTLEAEYQKLSSSQQAE